MKTIIYSILSFLFCVNSYSQSLDCINLTTGLAENEVIQIFAVDFLLNHNLNPKEDVFSEKYVLSVDGVEGSAIIDISEVGTYTYSVINTETNESCEVELVVEACEDCESPSTHNSSNVLAVCNSSVNILFSESKTIDLSNINAGSSSSNGGLIMSISDDPNYTFSPDDSDFTAQTSIELTENDICKTIIVRLFAADSKGNTGVCWTEVLVGSDDVDCGFSSKTDCATMCEDFVPLDPFTIKWPATFGASDLETFELNCKGLEAKELSSGSLSCADAYNALPSWCETECGLVGYSLEEVVYEGQSTSCKNVSRIWTVIDWCTFDPFQASNAGDSYAIVEDKRTKDCQDCPIDDDVYVRFVDVKPDGYYTFEQNIEIDKGDLTDNSSDLAPTDVPVSFVLQNGVPEVYPFSLSINNQAMPTSEKGFLYIPENSLHENENTISLSTLDNSDPLNGISTLDMVLSLQHLLGLRELTAPQIIAADLDKSGSISLAKDILKMRSLIIGIDKDIPGGDWFLVGANDDFSEFNKDDFQNDYSEFRFNKSSLDMEQGLQFKIFKYGDLNDSYSFTRSDSKADITFENIQLKKDKQDAIELTLASDDLGPIIGAQFSISVKDADIINIDHEYDKDLQFHIVDNNVRFSFVSNKAVDELKFNLLINSSKNQFANAMIQLEQNFTREFITEDYGVYDIELNPFDVSAYSGNEIDIVPYFNVFPNPAMVYVDLNVPKDYVGKTIEIFNVDGKLELKTMATGTKTRIEFDQTISKGLKIIKFDHVETQRLVIQ